MKSSLTILFSLFLFSCSTTVSDKPDAHVMVEYYLNHLKVSNWEYVPRKNHYEYISILEKDEMGPYLLNDVDEKSDLYIITDNHNITYFIWYKSEEVTSTITKDCLVGPDLTQKEVNHIFDCYKFYDINDEQNSLIEYKSFTQSELIKLKSTYF